MLGNSGAPRAGSNKDLCLRFFFLPISQISHPARAQRIPWKAAPMARIYDNRDIKFEDGLKEIIESPGVKRVDFCVGYFNLRGWKLVLDDVDSLEGDFVTEGRTREHRVCRLLVGMHQAPNDILRQLYSSKEFIADSDLVQRLKRQIAQDFRKQLLIGLPSKQDEWTLRRLSAQLRDKKVVVKLSAREPLHAKLYLAHRPEDRFNPILALMGSSNLTYAGLTKNGELNAEFADRDQAEKFNRWFEEHWNDIFSVDITQELEEAINESWAADRDIPPYWIYLKVAYHLSEEARNGAKEFVLPPEFQSILFDFQQNAVKMVARHLNNDKRRGAMIGDVVGLGKTITACAVAKIFEMAYASSTLIICPANLQEMWGKYIRDFNLKAEVMSMAKRIDIETMRYYRLIIIDESHNLRNGGKRYEDIKKLIDAQSSRVLLLTATPYNKHYNDLANQLRLFVDENQDLGIRPEKYIQSIGGEREFMKRHGDTHIRTIGAFQKSEDVDDWNELMRMFLVRRTRSFIKQYYAKTDPKNGRKYLEFNDGTRSYFPDRVPRSIKFPTRPGDQYSRLYSEEMVDLLESLSLPRYGLSNFVNEKAATEASTNQQIILKNLSKAGARMMGFCKSTLFKRMDSSGFSFLLSLYRHILRNCVYLYALDNKLELPVGDDNNLPEDYSEDMDNESGGVFGDDERIDLPIDGELNIPTDMAVYMRKAKEYYDILSQKNNVAWIEGKYFKRTLKQQLKKDCEIVIKMIELCGKWKQKEDQKLNELELLLDGTHPEHKLHGKDKAVIFTQYSDTARYIYNQLKKRGITHIDIATGNSQNPTAIVDKFSPNSNGKNLTIDEQTRVLVATDVLSEGQNLQDAHVIINYDLPWAIIRLIQRAGRVDRIGQKAEQIHCYSFFPAEGVEEIINLRGRLNERINKNANVVGSDEIFFEGNEQNLRDMFNERAGVLDDEEEDNEVDLVSQAYQIWTKAIKADKSLKEKIPNLQNMVYSTKATDTEGREGVITYARTASDFDILTWINADGEVVTQSQQRILSALACEPNTPAAPALDNHHELVKKAVEEVREQEQTSTEGMLGGRFSTRLQLVNLLEALYGQANNLIFTPETKEELKYAIDDIYKYPLQEASKRALSRMLRKGGRAMDDEILDYVLELRRNGQLCIIEEDETREKEHKIICSMGLRNRI